MRVHYGRNASIWYRWDGRDSQYGGRIVGVMSYYDKVKDDPRFELKFIRVGGQRLQPEQIKVYR